MFAGQNTLQCYAQINLSLAAKFKIIESVVKLKPKSPNEDRFFTDLVFKSNFMLNFTITL